MKYIRWKLEVERAAECESSVRLQKNVGKRDWRRVWTRDGVSEEAWYRKSEDAERAGKKGRSQSKYFLSIT